MNDNVLVFNNSELGILNAAISVNGDISFCLVDICRILRLQAKRVVERLAPLTCKKYVIDTKGGRQIANFIDVDTINELFRTYPNPLNKVLVKWINSEVVPALEANQPEENRPEEKNDDPIVIVSIAIL